MSKLTNMTRISVMSAVAFASPLFGQTDPNRPANMTTTARADDGRNAGFDMGWLGLLGLVGLAGLRRKSSEHVMRSDEGTGARVYPSKA